MRFVLRTNRGWITPQNTETGDLANAKRYDDFRDAECDCHRDWHIEALKEDRHFHSLDEAATAVQQLREDMLFNEEEIHLPRYAEQHLLMALALLEQAQRHLKIGWFDQMQPK